MTKKTEKKKTGRTRPIAVKEIRPTKTKAARKETPKLKAAKLRELAAKHKPPQSWFEEDLDAI